MQSKIGNSRKTDILIIVGIFLFALSVRVIYLNQIKTSPLFIPSGATLDEHLYDSWAKEIAFKDPIGKEAFWGLPLYPYFLALVYKLFGANVYIAKLIQFILGSLSCVFLYIIGKKVFNRPVGIISALTLSLYNAAIFYEGFLVSTSLSILLNCLLILLILSFAGKLNYKRSAMLGIAFGLCGLATPSIFLFIPFMAALFWRNIRQILLMVFLCCLVIAPVTIRNYVLEKDFIPITAHTGITFFSGNNPMSDGTFKLPLYLGTGITDVRRNSRDIAEKTLGKRLKPSQVSGFWVQQSMKFIREEPTAYLKLLFRKFLLFWNHYEISDIIDISFFKKFSGLLRGPLVNYASISVFALLGLFMSLKRKNRNRLLLQLFILSNVISLEIYFINTRYRLPVVPFLILFSSYAIYEIYLMVAQKKYVALSYCLGGLIVFGLIVNLKLMESSAEVAYTNMGLFYQNKQMYKEAIEEYKKALELNPKYPLAHNNLGILYKKSGRFDEAIKEYETAISLDPGYLNPCYNLGLLYLERGQLDKAAEYFEKALTINPDFTEAKDKLAACRRSVQNLKSP